MGNCFGSQDRDAKKRTGDTTVSNQNAHCSDEDESETGTGGDTYVSQNALSRYPKLQEAQDFIAERKKGSIRVSLNGPKEKGARIWSSLSIAGETGKVEEDSPRCEHPAFELYWIRDGLFTQKTPNNWDTFLNHEVFRFFDGEAYPKYHHVHPGTVTVRGYGKECWFYELFFGSGPREAEYLYHTGELSEPGPVELLRRLHELQAGERKIGENAVYDEADVLQFVGPSALDIAKGKTDGPSLLAVCLAVLNRTDTFKNLMAQLSLAQEWTHLEKEGRLGMFKFIWQLVIAGEVARRLDIREGSQELLNGLTVQVIASLLIYDLWVQNVEVKISKEAPMPPVTEEVSPEKRREAEVILRMAEKLVGENRPDAAAEVLEEAVAIDPANFDYRRRRYRALYRTAELDALIGDEEDSEMRYLEAAVEAKYLTQYAPDNWESWEMLADAHMGRGAIKKALQAYEEAHSLATDPVNKKAMGDRVVKARNALADEFLAAAGLKNKRKQHNALKCIKDQDFEFADGSLNILSKVHERQEEGLVVFAETIKWPCLNEVSERVGDAYTKYFSIQEILPVCLHDWLYGLVFPGRFFAYNIMNSVVLSTSSLSIGASPNVDYGLVIGDVAYWTTQTVMGRVLGAVPGIKSVVGWVGPCPSVEFDIESENDTKPQARWVAVTTERVPPKLQPKKPSCGPLDFLDSDDPDSYVADIVDPKEWTTPEPPARDMGSYTLKSIRLKPTEEAERSEFTARITFEVNEEIPIEIHLRTNPVFVVPPRCHLADPAGHSAHTRELDLYKSQTWTPEKLVEDDNFAQAKVADILIINATGEGAETMARAVCAFRGMNAVIRTSGGPCFQCAIRAARGLNINVLVWCD